MRSRFCFFILFILLFSPSSVRASDLPDGKWVIAEMQKQNESINDFVVTMNINFYAYLMYFPIRSRLYFKRPDKVKIVFLNMPEFLRGYEKQFKAIVPTETLKKKYRCKVVGKETIGEKTHYVLKMTPLEEGNLKQVHMWVHSEIFIPSRMFLTYKDKSTIEVENEFVSSDGVYVIKKQKIDFNLTSLSAKSIVTYSDYRVNKGIPDSFFQEKKKEKK